MADHHRAKTVLVAEDRPQDRGLLRYAVAATNHAVILIFVHDGTEVIQYLTGKGQFSDRDAYPIPDLLLLDAKMPGLSGLDVLDWLERSEEFKSLKVVMFTASEDPDLLEQLKIRQTAVVQKPATLDGLIAFVKTLPAYAE